MRKNIILFLTDQWRWDTLNQPGHPAKLPNLMAFREEATNFTNAYTSVPLCTPARASLFTGKWPHQTGTMDNVQGKAFYPHGKLHPSQKTYMERLRDDGYEVCFIGKWHLGDGTLTDRGIPDTPLCDGGDVPLMRVADDLEFAAPRKTPFYGTLDAGTPLDEQRVNIAIDRLDALQSTGRPFCLIVSLHGPHFPHHVPRRYVELYDDLPDDYMPDNYCPQFSETGKPRAQSAFYWPCQDTSGLTQQDWRRTAQHYWGFCSWIDDLFGRFRARVQDAGLDETSVLAFTTDHGEMLGAHGWFDKGPFFYDEVMRIPMLIRDPGQGKGNGQGAETGSFVSFRDLFPTLIDRAGAHEVLSVAEARRSFWSTGADHVTYCYDAYQGRQFKFRGIRTERYKYAWSPHDIEELYDLQTDLQERENRADDPDLATVKADLNTRLFAWMKAERDPLWMQGYQLPVGSYIDGRDVSEQHVHSE
ncbi:sulfatase-like hydrolase/transferase [Shimia biformata]|uniref:sulfatase-like hydrolase/transferase n=1 Tax=Shimia biformata TaxID=1294299 RepID=UPI0019513F02|nr:sulfatase-like hydrolase/transferase [Shimia biformata]